MIKNPINIVHGHQTRKNDDLYKVTNFSVVKQKGTLKEGIKFIINVCTKSYVHIIH